MSDGALLIRAREAEQGHVAEMDNGYRTMDMGDFSSQGGSPAAASYCWTKDTVASVQLWYGHRVLAVGYIARAGKAPQYYSCDMMATG